MSCDTFGSDIKTQLQDYGDYNCDGQLNIADIVALVNDILAENTNKNIGDIVTLVNKILDNTQDHETALQQIISSQDSTQDLTQDSTQDLTQVTRQQAQEEFDTAAESDPDIGINKLAIINVPRTPGTPADGFNIFFKGPEVLEYLVTFGDNVDSTIKTLANQSLFHNLFTTTDPEYSEQAFRTDGTKVYQARRSNVDDIRPNTTYVWDSTYLIHMFTSPYPITSLTKIQFQDGIVLDTTTNPTASNSVAIRTILPS